MKHTYLLNAILVVLVLLAASSGITKIALMQQDVDFFGVYGFTKPILVAYGVSQLLGAILLALRKTRILGACVVAVTFIVSAIFLAMAGNIPVTFVTLICVLLLGLVIKNARNKNAEHLLSKGTRQPDR